MDITWTKNIFETFNSISDILSNIKLDKLDEKQIVALFNAMISRYPSSDDYIRRTVIRLAKEEQYKNNDGTLKYSVRVTIIKKLLSVAKHIPNVYNLDSTIKFITNPNEDITDTNREYYKKKAEEIVDEKDFERFESLKKDKRKNLILFKCANDLANSKFRNNQTTREYLFWFAIAFNMTINLDRNNIIAESDVNKNLFEDYYDNNLLRYIKYNDGGEEKEPSSAGINYRNFRDIIYVYYINKSIDPSEKLEKSLFMIKKCVNKAKQEGVQKIYSIEKNGKKNYYYFLKSKKSNKDITLFYKDELNTAMHYDEEKFFDFIINNYDISTKNNDREIFNQKTAYMYYSKIVRKTGDAIPTRPDLTILEKSLANTNALELIYLVAEYITDFNLEEFEFSDSDICEIDDFTVSRTRFIAAYYQLFLNRFSKWEKLKSLNDIYNAFRREKLQGMNISLNNMLNNCRYQEFNVRNLYDALIIIFLYLSILDKK